MMTTGVVLDPRGARPDTARLADVLRQCLNEDLADQARAHELEAVFRVHALVQVGPGWVTTRETSVWLLWGRDEAWSLIQEITTDPDGRWVEQVLTHELVSTSARAAEVLVAVTCLPPSDAEDLPMWAGFPL
ncbi:hypothetical protein [Cellulomonas soli]|uniref:Uncharacterized protein n=1 Tax=Cellulomonas soli TaxID=931535 RepID=A0A512PHN5_9CELL|nr:hypothetical protein [Cellulomonas soli]NYI59188.1 hypothetical protein [Cellulomonas soli]GEP70693.1 hypothetical protein CSO01_34080 [Cellulomonas soli]